MNYLYHRVPPNMSGNTLFPLNTLKETYPDIYEKQVSKYEGREQVMLQHIPILNCLWNDVLHLSAVHPSIIKQALIDAGRTDEFMMEVFEIDPHLLSPENTVVYLYHNSDVNDKFNTDNWIEYNPDDIANYAVLPEVTKDYYKEMISSGKKPLLFLGVPHILYKGSIDISKIKKFIV